VKRKVTWKDKALASKQLHDALNDAGFSGQIEPRFVNIVDRGASTLIRDFKGYRVGMGAKVQLWLAKRGLVHIPLIHPAARGTIRKKERYAAHVAASLQHIVATVANGF